MKNSTLLRAFLAVLAGILIMPFVGVNDFYYLAGFFAAWLFLLLVILFFASKFPFVENLFSFFVIVGCFLLGYILAAAQKRCASLPENRAVNISGIISDAPVWRKSKFGFNTNLEFYGTFDLKLLKIQNKNNEPKNVNEKIRCIIINNKKIELQRGDYINVSGKFYRYRHAKNPGEFDIANYFELKGINYKFVAKNGALKWKNPDNLSVILSLRRKLDTLRNKLAAAFSSTKKYETEAGILRRMILGTRETLPEKLAELLQKTNTFHIIAISGLHIGIVCGIWWLLMWLVGTPWKYRGLSLLPVLWLYAMMVGLRASVIRAGLMFSALAIAPLIKRSHSAAQALLLAGFFFIIFLPKEIYAFGTQLTFLAVGALLSIAYLITNLLERTKLIRGPEEFDIEHLYQKKFYALLKYFVQIIGATIAIWLATWPVTLMRNNLITPLSWLANLCVVPALGIVLGLGFGALFFSFFLPGFAQIINGVNLFFLHLLLKLINFVGEIPLAFFSFKTLDAVQLFLYYSALTAAFLFGMKILKREKKKRLVGSAACLLFCLFFFSLKNNNSSLKNSFYCVTLDVGLGDAAVIHTPSGKNILIDGGVRYGTWSMGSRVVIPYLRAAGISKIDAVICSHFDRDHVGGIIDVLKFMKVEKIYSPPLLSTNFIASELKQIARKKNITWKEIFAGDKLCFNSVTATVINPPAIITNNPASAAQWGGNPWSVVTRWEWGDRSFLTTGDATIASEALEIANGYKVKSDVLKAGHHGSASSSSDKFLKAVKPVVTIISVGKNSLGLPAPEIMKKINKESEFVVNTKKSGAIMTIFNNSGIEVKKFFGQE